jgi:hypothetical protein
MTLYFRENVHYWLMALPVLLGAAMLVYATSQGPAIAGDATVFINSALNLVEGNGLGILGPDGNFRYLSHYPPFYPFVLAVFYFIGFDLIESARWLNVAFFAMAVLAVGFVSRWVSGSTWFSLASQLLYVASPILIYQYVWAMSEPLSITLGFGGIFLLLSWLKKPRSLYWLLSAFGVGLAFLTRLIGAAFVLAGAVVILLLGKGSWKRRASGAIYYLAAGSIPMIIWSIVDMWRTSTLASRGLGLVDFASAPAEHFSHIFRSLQSVFESWLVPASWVIQPPYPSFITTIFLLLAAGLLIFSATYAVWKSVKQEPRHWKRDPAVMLQVSLLVFFALYMLLAVFLYKTVLPRIDLNNRMFLPAHAAALGIVLITGYLLIRTSRGVGWLPFAVYTVFLGMIALYGFRSLRIVADLNENMIGYLGKSWQNSETVQAVRSLPPETVFITNEEAALLFFTGHAAYPVMEFYQLQPQPSMTSFGDLETDDIQMIFREEGAALVLFDTMYEQLSDLYGDDTPARVEILTRGLYPYFLGSDGGVYFYDKPGEGIQ